jgi:class 3 adenylate cyclase
MTAQQETDSSASDGYLLLADISGYTGFLTNVEQVHGVDFSGGIPAGFAVLGVLLDGVVKGVEPEFRVAKLEGDAVFAIAPADALDGKGDSVVSHLQGVHRAFRTRRTEARLAQDHVCTACPVVANLDLKMVLHRGRVFQQAVGSRTEILGPAVNVAHRLLKNTIPAHIGYRPYLFLTDAAAIALGLAEAGLEHTEQYPDVGRVSGRILDLEVS